MSPELSNQLTRALNKFIKNIFHSSTLSTKVSNVNGNQIEFNAIGISNKMLKNIYLSFGESFTNNLIEKLIKDNILVLIQEIEKETNLKMDYTSFHADAKHESYSIFLSTTEHNKN